MHWLSSHEQELQAWLPAIRTRLEEFRAVPPGEYFYELCYCLCTPQSKAIHAEAVVSVLKKREFHQRAFDPASTLGNPSHYIRFHHTKAQRLLAMREQYADIERMMQSAIPAMEKHAWLVKNVNGLSNKEASHFLRNIGYRNMVILDRHILKHLVAHQVLPAVPSIATSARYHAVAGLFVEFAESIGYTVDELDLFFWASETGFILK
jgi:N-glycosylase/DNA lyase